MLGLTHYSPTPKFGENEEMRMKLTNPKFEWFEDREPGYGYQPPTWGYRCYWEDYMTFVDSDTGSVSIDCEFKPIDLLGISETSTEDDMKVAETIVLAHYYRRLCDEAVEPKV